MKYVFLGSIDFKVLLVIILYFNASLLKAKIDLAASSLFGNPRINQLTSFEASSFEKFDPRESIFRAFLPIRTLAPNYIRNEDIELVGGFLIPTERCIERIIKDYFFELVGNDHLGITAERVSGGGFSEAIYVIRFGEKQNDKNVLFVKINKTIGKNKLWENLQEVQVQVADKLVDLDIDLHPDFPILIMPKKFLKYSFQDEEKIIEIMYAAQGEDLDSLLIGPAVSLKELEASNVAVGRALSLFHQAFMVYADSGNVASWDTILHGDFHQMNVFVKKFLSPVIAEDTQSKAFYRVYFIDNETMIHSIRKPQPILLDILRYSMQRLAGSKGYMYENLCNTHFCQTRYQTMVRSFLKGYVEAYPESRRNLVIEYILRELRFRVEHLIDIITSGQFNLAPNNLGDMSKATILKEVLRARIEDRLSPVVDAELDIFLRSCIKMREMNMSDPRVQATALAKIKSLFEAISAGVRY